MNICLSSVDEPLLDSTHLPSGFLEDSSSTGSPPLALPASNYSAFERPDSPGALLSVSEPSYNISSEKITHFSFGHVASENSTSFTTSIASLNPSKPVVASSPQFETAAKLSTTWKQTRADSAKQSFPPSPKPTRSQPQPQSNIYVESSSPSVFARSTTPHLGLNSKQKVTSLSGMPLESPNLAFDDSLVDQSYSNVLDLSQLRPSITPFEKNKPARDMNMLPYPDEILAPSYNVPFIAPHHTSPSLEPTDVSPEDFYPTNTMELDWGSGDYLETMSYLNSDGEDYSLVTKVPSDSYELEEYTENYDTSFPSRVGISPASLHLVHVSPTPSLVTAHNTVVPLKSTHTPSFSPMSLYTLKPTSASNSDIPDASDLDWSDTFTIQPTDVLLPDMNSLEYYTTQLTKENNSLDTGAEQRGNVSTVSISGTDTTPTSSPTNSTNLTEDEPSSDLSGFEPQDESTTVVTTEESPHMASPSEPFLDPSIVPTHFFDPSSSTWGTEVSSKNWPASPLTVSIDSTASTEPMPPSATPLLPDDVISYSSLTDVHWFVTESISPPTIHTTSVLTATTDYSPVPTVPFNTTAGTTEVTPQDSTFTTQQTLNITLVSTEPTSNGTSVPPEVLGDQGVTEDGADIPATMTLIPTSSDANTISVAPTTPTATTTSHQATTRTATTTDATTSVSLISTTSGKITTTATSPRLYICNLNRPVYLVKVGTNRPYLYFVSVSTLFLKYNVYASSLENMVPNNYLNQKLFFLSWEKTKTALLISFEGFPSGVTIGFAKSQIKDILKGEFNNSVELQVNSTRVKHFFI